MDELLTMLDGALANMPLSTCIAGGSSQDSEMTIDEIIVAVNNAHGSCSGM